ncbi:MAG: hypothetical protein VB089_19795 [Anaerolineaceae bacterium]|nr:hypothetical protein [Anaerolineaceae bacterium]
MDKQSVLARLLAALSVLAVVAAVYWFGVRSYQLQWGATAEEIQRPMPGDELDPDPAFLSTRAITIDAAPQAIWPWLLQMGYGRAGFYGYDILENVGSPRGMASADRIMSEFQGFVVGDVVPISSVAQEVFYAIQPDEYLIWAGESGEYPGGFTWALYPLDAQHTRLVVRIRWSHHGLSQPGLLSLDLFTELTDHIAVRKILHGIQGRVEGHIEPAWVANAEFSVFVLAAMVFLAALILLLLRPFTWPGWLAALAAGLGWLATWYAPLPWWAGGFLELLLLAGLFGFGFKIVKLGRGKAAG